MSNQIKDVQGLFRHYLLQLKQVVEKTPEALFAKGLAEDMFPLETNAKIAANFLLRGYAPLIGEQAPSFEQPDSGKAALLTQIELTEAHLISLPAIVDLNPDTKLRDRAGFVELELPPYSFIYQYIFPNFLFHLSMVYAIARANGVALSKADFDGLHSYPEGFSFVEAKDEA